MSGAGIVDVNIRLSLKWNRSTTVSITGLLPSLVLIVYPRLCHYRHINKAANFEWSNWTGFCKMFSRLYYTALAISHMKGGIHVSVLENGDNPQF